DYCCRQPTFTNTIFELPLSGPTALQWTRHDVLPAGFRMRQGASFSYDAARDVAWLYGGEDSTFTSLGDMWQVSLAGVPAVAPVAAARDDDLQLAPAAAPFTRGDLAVRVTLPGPGAGTLDLFDVSGRLTRRVRIDGVPSGTHTVKLAGRGELRAGIYFARLRRAAAERRLRLVVLP